MSGIRGVVAVLVVAVLVVGSGCARSDDGASGEAAASGALPVDPAAQSVVDELRALPFDESKRDVVAGLLAEAGVGVYPDDATDGSEPVRLTEWQVGNLAAEAANGGGVTGETLRELAPMPEGAPPISYLLAAWVTAYPSPSAGFARALLGEQEWEQADQVVFPKLLLTLFVADAVAAGPQGYQPEQSDGQAAALWLLSTASSTQANVCSAASSFIQQAISAVAEALKVDTSGGGILGFLGSIWNVAVDLAAGVVRGLVKAFQDLAVGLLVDAFALVAVVQEVYSYVVEWRADLIAVPEENRFGVGDEVVTGELELQVVDNQLPVPALVLDCAKVFGVDMSRVGSAEGATVDWDFYVPPVRPDLATPTSSDPELDAQRTARYGYQTGQESPELARTGDQRAALFRLKATARRDDLEKIRQLLTSLVLDRLPAAIADVVRSLADPLFKAVTDRLGDLVDPDATELVAVSFHVPGEPTDPPEQAGGASPPDQQTQRGVVPKGCPRTETVRHGDLDPVVLDAGAPGNVLVLSDDPTVEGKLCTYFVESSYVASCDCYGDLLAVGVLQNVPKGTESNLLGERIELPGTDAASIDTSQGIWLGVVVGDSALVIQADDHHTRDQVIAMANRILGLG